MPKQTRVSFYLPIVLAVLIFLGWLLYTPNGVMGKADAVGYAVCHRIEERSFLLGERPMPLCARCSGMYLGALLAMVYQQPWRKWGGLPSRTVWVVVGIFLVLFGVDGLNSYLHLFPLAPHVYPPANWLRLVTGTGLGLGIGIILMPLLHQSLWVDWVDRPAFSGWRSLAGLLAAAAGLVLAILWKKIWILYPLAILSAITVLLMLGFCYTVLWAHFLKRENQAGRLVEALPLLAMGFGTAIVQVFAFDVVRFLLTGTWQGFSF